MSYDQILTGVNVKSVVSDITNGKWVSVVCFPGAISQVTGGISEEVTLGMKYKNLESQGVSAEGIHAKAWGWKVHTKHRSLTGPRMEKKNLKKRNKT